MYEYKAKITEVIDGDTVDAMIDLGFDIWHKIRIRLFGLNCPESRTSNEIEKPYGLAAKQFTKDRIEGQEVRVEIHKQEKFGRYLAIIHYQSNNTTINLNSELIGTGHAKAYFGEKRGPFKEK
jgi:micrococcal nuclease